MQNGDVKNKIYIDNKKPNESSKIPSGSKSNTNDKTSKNDSEKYLNRKYLHLLFL
jgi:hypothetical protein